MKRVELISLIRDIKQGIWTDYNQNNLTRSNEQRLNSLMNIKEYRKKCSSRFLFINLNLY